MERGMGRKLSYVHLVGKYTLKLRQAAEKRNRLIANAREHIFPNIYILFVIRE
jgi:hypothetical protein